MNSRLSLYFFFAIVCVAGIASFIIFWPFLTPLVLAVAASIIVYPLYRFFLRIFGLHPLGRTISALITVIILSLVILIPLLILVGNVYSEIQTLYAMLTDEGNRSSVIDFLNNGSQNLSNLLFGVLPAQSFDGFNVTLGIKEALALAFSNLDNIFGGLAKVAGYALIFLISTFYFLRDGKSLKQTFISWSPILSGNEEYITLTFKRAVRSVFAGTLVVSLLEGISLGLAFLVFGIPAPALWGVIAAVAALIPGFGVTLLIIPGAIYLYVTGHLMFSIGLLVWGYAGIVIIDHYIGPNLINKALKIHPLLILLSVLGGLIIFGIIGFLLGPMILVFLLTLIEVYRMSNRSENNSPAEVAEK